MFKNWRDSYTCLTGNEDTDEFLNGENKKI